MFFIALALPLAVMPVPFVSWRPGGTADVLGDVDGRPLITISDTSTYPTSGQLDLTMVSGTSADGTLTLPEALLSYVLPGRDTLPRDSVFPPDQSPAEVANQEAELMETSQDNAIVAALREAGQPVVQLPAVASVTVGGPAYEKLKAGDLILAVDDVRVRTIDAVRAQISSHRPGQTVEFTVLRQQVKTRVAVVAGESATDQGAAVVGITLGPGYSYQPKISFDLGQKIGGPSAGLVFALGIYDKITPGELLNGRNVAGTGSIGPTGVVGSIGGVRQKLASAERSGATAFLVPKANCGELAGVRTDLVLIEVTTLDQAINELQTLNEYRGSERVSRC